MDVNFQHNLTDNFKMYVFAFIIMIIWQQIFVLDNSKELFFCYIIALRAYILWAGSKSTVAGRILREFVVTC